ncbi:AEC family transporter [Flavonifractor sp. An100]|uniref:AEC family transporter n=1 Tax=Flavonifractor sp. An100 TaxID=1965538 RepID=UPI0013023300|nr:AEC family transporter [Flavonifractor sp. An100]
MENFIVSLNCVIPMFLTLCVGFLVRRAQVVPEVMFHHLSTLSFQALLPCLLFYNIYSTDLTAAVQSDLLAYLIAWVLVWFALCYAYYTLREPDPRRRGAYIQNSFRSNIAVIGVSLAQVMMSSHGVALLSIAISLVVPLFNILAVITLETCRGNRVDLRHTLSGIFHNPLIRACLLGILFLLLGIRLPSSVEQAVSSLGNAGSVTTLLALGASFRIGGLTGQIWTVVRCSLVRLVLAPAAALIPAILLGFRGDTLGAILVCVATPTASSSYPMALACGSDHELTAQLVVSTSLFCSLTLFLWIFLLKQIGLL